MMTISKGLTSGYFPLAGSVVGEQVWAVLEEGSTKYGPFSHGFTYAAHPLGAAVALTNLDIIEREELVENAARQGTLLRRRLAEERGSPAFVVFSDAALRGLATAKPTTPEAMLRVSGVGPAKLEQYGEAFLAAIREYAGEARSAAPERSRGARRG